MERATAAGETAPLAASVADANWTQLGADVEAYESNNAWVCPNGWYEGIKTATGNGAKQAAVDELLEAAAAKLVRPVAKLRASAKANYDPDAAANAMLAAMQTAVDPKGAFESGLLPEMPGDPAAFPFAFADVTVEGDVCYGRCLADGRNLVDTNTECYGKFVELAGGPERAVIGVLSIPCVVWVTTCRASGLTTKPGTTSWRRHAVR